MKTLNRIKVLVVLAVLVGLTGCSKDKKSSSRVGVGGSGQVISGNVCYINGVAQPSITACQGGGYVLENNICYQYINGGKQPVNPSFCNSTGGTGGCVTIGICSGTYWWFDNMVTQQWQQRYCNAALNDCRGYTMTCNNVPVNCQ